MKPQAEYKVLQAAQAQQVTDALETKNRKRTGIAGIISHRTHSFDLRRFRYIGVARTHLQHLATAAAMNLARIVVWLMGGKPKAQTSRAPFAALAAAT